MVKRARTRHAEIEPLTGYATGHLRDMHLLQRSRTGCVGGAD